MAYTTALLLLLVAAELLTFIQASPLRFADIPETNKRRLLLSKDSRKLPAIFPSPDFWSLSKRGHGVRVAILDSGIDMNAVQEKLFNNIIEARDFTDESSVNDELGHGTFMAGIIANNGQDCPGLAPDAELYIFKVFDRNGGMAFDVGENDN